MVQPVNLFALASQQAKWLAARQSAVAGNIANINTTGFKRARAEFSDLLYQTERLAGVPNRANQSVVP